MFGHESLFFYLHITLILIFPGRFSDIIFSYHISSPFSLFFIFRNTNTWFVKPSYSILHLLVLFAGIPGISVVLDYPMLTLWLGKERFLHSMYCRGQCKFGSYTSVASDLGFWFLLTDACVHSWNGQKSSNFLLAWAGEQSFSSLHLKFRAAFVKLSVLLTHLSPVSASCLSKGALQLLSLDSRCPAPSPYIDSEYICEPLWLQLLLTAPILCSFISDHWIFHSVWG